jgi:4-aminobutyrate aminotransferase-like enzyme
MPLSAEQFLSDPAIAQAKHLMLQSLAAHQKPLAAIRPPDPARKIPYDDLINHFNSARGGNLFFPYLGSGFGNGPFVELADGSVKLDFINGIGVHHFGHSNAKLIAAALDAALRDTIMQGNLQQNTESTKIAATLVQRANSHVPQPPSAVSSNNVPLPPSAVSSLAHCFLSTSGAMANENALKLAFHKRPNTTRVIAFEHTFAGRTLALSSLTDKAAYRIGLPPALEVDYLPYFDHANPEASTTRAVETLRHLLDRYPNQHAALWCELVLGEGGFYPGSEKFFQSLITLARSKNLLIVADEIQTFGRTPQLFAFQHFNLDPDIVTMGKMLQICATLFTDALRPAPGIISQTFTASTSAIFAAQTILSDLLTPDLFGPAGKNTTLHNKFVDHFNAIATRHPAWIRGPYGLGGMIAFTPFDGAEEKTKKLLHALYQNGLIAFYNGSNPTRIRFLPPLPILTESHITVACQILESTMAQLAQGFTT